MLPATLWAVASLLMMQPATAAGAKLDLLQDELVHKGDHLLETYDIKAPELTSDGFTDLYFDVFEGKGLEKAIGAVDPDGKKAVEKLFSDLIGLSSSAAPSAQIAECWQKLKKRLTAEMQLLPATDS